MNSHAHQRRMPSQAAHLLLLGIMQVKGSKQVSLTFIHTHIHTHIYTCSDSIQVSVFYQSMNKSSQRTGMSRHAYQRRTQLSFSATPTRVLEAFCNIQSFSHSECKIISVLLMYKTSPLSPLIYIGFEYETKSIRAFPSFHFMCTRHKA